MKSMRQIRHGIMLLCCCVWFNSHVLASSHTMPNIQTWKTSQGVRVYFAQRTRLPMLDINLVFNAGSSRDPQTQSGLSQLTASLLNQGTTKLSVDQIANQFGHYGSVYEAESTQDWLAVHLRSLTQAEALSSSVALLNQLVTTSTFNQEAVNRKKSQAMIALKYEIQNPTKLVQQAFLKALYGTGPYGHNPLGTPEGVNAITVEAIKSFYHRYVVSKNACIVMVGDLSLSQAKAVSEKLLNGLPQGHAAPELTFTEMQKKNRVHLSSKAKQTTVILGYLGITRESPDYFPLLVGNHMMGGMPLSSILFDVIRNHNGLAYSVSSVLNPLQQPGPWFVLLQTRANQSQQAIESVNTIIQSMKVRPITKKELNTVKANLVGSFPIAIATNDGLLEVITRIAFYHRPLDYMSTFKDHVNAVTADDIHHAFQHLLLQHTPIIVTVGPGKDHAT